MRGFTVYLFSFSVKKLHLKFCGSFATKLVSNLVAKVCYHKKNEFLGLIPLKSSGDRARKRNKTKSLIKFKSRGHTGVVISMRGRRQFKVEKQICIDKF